MDPKYSCYSLNHLSLYRSVFGGFLDPANFGLGVIPNSLGVCSNTVSSL
jgi:hypothetical protein